MMKPFLLSSLAALCFAGAPTLHAQTEPTAAMDLPPQEALTIERLYASPSLSGPAPRGVKFSPDGKRVTFLKAREAEQERFDLWAFDVATGEAAMLVDSKLLEPEDVTLSEEEKALRERKRIAGSKGIVSYDWGDERTLLVPIGGDIHVVFLEGDTPRARKMTDTDAFEYDARISPAGGFVSFVRDGAVYAIDLNDEGAETRLTPLAEPENAVAYGVAEFVAQEEMSRYTGYWWSPDDRFLAFTRVDKSMVDIIPRFEIDAGGTTVIEQRYPRAGRPNAVVDLFVRDMQTGEVSEIGWRREDWGPATDQYMARVNWVGDALFVQAVNRDQTLIRYLKAEGDGWPVEAVWAESQRAFVNLSDDFTVTDDHILTTSEQGNGYRHIEARTRSNDSWFAITEGDWVVSAIKGVDREFGLIYFTGYMDTPLEKQLYVQRITPSQVNTCTRCAGVRLEDGPPPVRLTEPGKSWSITMSPDGKSFVGTSSSPDQPPQTALYSVAYETSPVLEDIAKDEWGDIVQQIPAPVAPQVSRIAWIEENALDASHPYAPLLADHTVPEFGTLTAEDGQTLHYSIQKPPGFDPSRKYPVLVEVYGGPHVQTVTRDWERLSDQFYTRQGYIVFRLDNRGSSNRGKGFEDVIFRRIGGPEVADQLVGVDWLKAQPFVDADRVAMQGWSYGGYMTLMTVLQAPQGSFAAAVAGAPVTDWSLYDTFYTERYMDTPQDNGEGYAASSVFPYVENLSAPLLLVHGMADDNVTFDNTTKLMAALQEAGKTFELMTYPGQRHGIRGEALQIHLMKTRMAFLNRHLKPE